jgi:RNA polymerase sigma-70 factor (ECF subfamily)
MDQPSELQACISGERLAQQRFYERFKGRMFALCLRYANNREDAEDMLQEGFLRVFRDLHQYSGAGHFEGWVRKIFVNTALQHLQKSRKGITFVELKGEEYIEDHPVALDVHESQARQMVKILQQLPPGFRAVFNLHILEGYTHPEIADILGISVGTSKSQLLRAKNHFRKLLDKTFIED